MPVVRQRGSENCEEVTENQSICHGQCKVSDSINRSIQMKDCQFKTTAETSSASLTMLFSKIEVHYVHHLSIYLRQLQTS